MDFKACPEEPCIFTKVIGKPPTKITLALIVDDIISTSPSENILLDFEENLETKFTLSSKGPITWWNGCKVVYDRVNKSISFNYKSHIVALIEKLGMTQCVPMDTPAEPNSTLNPAEMNELLNENDRSLYMSIVGGLMYLATHACPEIQHAVNRCASFMHAPGTLHMAAAKRIIRYLAGTIKEGKPPLLITYSFRPGSFKQNLDTYVDASWGGDLFDGRAWTGVLIMLNGGPIAWQSKRQPTTALSSAEAEYMGMTEATKLIKYIASLVCFLSLDTDSLLINPFQIKTDSTSAMHLANNPVSSQRSRHINVRYHFIREAIANGEITLKFVGTADQWADILTKALALPQFKFLVKRIYGLSG